MSKRVFRFGVVTAMAPSGAEWLAKARRIEELGYSTLLVPDRLTPPLLSPIPALAAAAAATSRLRLGTFVIAAGLRNPAVLAKDAATLDFLSNGRFELGLGAGTGEDDYRLAGVPMGTPGERADRLAATLAIVRELLAGETLRPKPLQQPLPILMAAGGKRMIREAVRGADTVLLGYDPKEGEAGLAERVEIARAAMVGDGPELGLNLVAVVGPEGASPALQGRVRGFLGMGLDELIRDGSPLVVHGDVDAICAQVNNLRDRYSISYVTLPDDVMDTFAPVVARLTGR